MKNFLIFILLLLLCRFTYAQDDIGDEKKIEVEDLKKTIEERKIVAIKKIGGDLIFSGEVRVEFQKDNEKKSGIRQRGEGSTTNRPANAFDVEVNLMFDYCKERTWAGIKIELDNDMGIFCGSGDHLNLEKAYLGGRMIDGDTFTFDGELGRKLFSDAFESKIEFNSRFDGLLLKFNKAFESIGAFYVNIGAFLVNDYYNHFGEVAELALLDVGNTGFFIKYSFINWKKHYSDFVTNERFNYANSQIILGYQGTTFNKSVKVYLAGLINHLANHLTLADKKYNHRYNLATYIGLSYGRILKKGDWALNTNLEYVMPQAVPGFDSSGIGRGNAESVGLYTENFDGTGALTTSSTAVGNTNFKGFIFEFLYAITDNLTIFQIFKISNNQTKKVGPYMTYKRYEMEFIYAF